MRFNNSLKRSVRRPAETLLQQNKGPLKQPSREIAAGQLEVLSPRHLGTIHQFRERQRCEESGGGGGEGGS